MLEIKYYKGLPPGNEWYFNPKTNKGVVIDSEYGTSVVVDDEQIIRETDKYIPLIVSEEIFTNFEEAAKSKDTKHLNDIIRNIKTTNLRNDFKPVFIPLNK